MKSIAFAGAVLAMLAPAMAAEAVQPQHVFAMLPHSEHFDPAKTITSTRFMFHTRADWRGLAAIEFSMPYVAELDGTVPADIQSTVGIGGKTPLNAGAVLYGSAAVNGETLYCTRVRSILLDMMGAACLVDTDEDGFFDEATKGANNTWDPEAIAMSGVDLAKPGKNNLMSLHLSHRVALQEPIAYHAREQTQAPRMYGNLAWASDYVSAAEPNRPIQFMFAYRLWTEGSGGVLISEVARATYTGTPVEVDLNGIKLVIQGIGPAGELICTMDGEIDPHAIPMAHFQNPIPIW